MVWGRASTWWPRQENICLLLIILNEIFLGFIIATITIDVAISSRDKGKEDDYSNTAIFFPVRSTSVFMSGGFSDWNWLNDDYF